SKLTYIKRFIPEALSSARIAFVEEKKAEVLHSLSAWLPMISVNKDEINVAEFIDVMKYKAKGKKLSKDEKIKIKILQALPYEEPEVIEESIEEEQTNKTPVIFGDDDFNPNDNGVQGNLFE
ncbi:MAG: hypothetical protein HUK18_04535, partial [Bacteroidales bacterium]|nr:hypothetical protein [Bacteroidales bacterium]